MSFNTTRTTGYGTVKQHRLPKITIGLIVGAASKNQSLLVQVPCINNRRYHWHITALAHRVNKPCYRRGTPSSGF